ncbi:hypothetical protein AB6A40_007030 [Gnathostoma spinigerum]|uniref:Uncharacterized protein n=1 Tax=Gnathostoma spinigerum TaxID=75299 RepID=A0ABD6ES89_9BILA
MVCPAFVFSKLVRLILEIQQQPFASSVIVRGFGEDRYGSSVGVVSKGAMKEFPPSVAKQPTNFQSQSQLTSASRNLMGLNRPHVDASSLSKNQAQQRSLHSPRHSSSDHHYSSQLNSSSLSSGLTVPSAQISRSDPMLPTANVRKTADPMMCELSARSEAFRAHCSSVIEEELNRNESQAGRSLGLTATSAAAIEVKRKSGIHTVYLPSLPQQSHHQLSMKTVHRSALSPPLPIQRSSTSSQNPLPASNVFHQSQAGLARASPLGSTQKPPPSSVPPGSSGSHISSPTFSHLSAATPLVSQGSLPFRSTASPTAASFPSSTRNMRSSHLASPRTPLSINPNLTSPLSSQHSSPVASNVVKAQSASSSPFPMSPSFAPSSPGINRSPRPSSFTPTLLFHAPFTQPLLSSAVTSPVAASPLSSSLPAQPTISNTLSTSTTSTTLSESPPEMKSPASKSEVVIASANYEPLSPDTAESPPPSEFVGSVPTGTPDQTCMPLFSLLNLPDNGSSTSTTPTRPTVPQTDQISPPAQKGLSAGPSLSLSSSSQNVSSNPRTPVPSSKPPPQPTYEPLSDDDE